MIVTAIRAWVGHCETIECDVPVGATVTDVRAQLGWEETGYAIYGQTCTATQIVQEGDRIEFLRELTADPKEVRRRRAANNPLPRTFRMPKKIRQHPPADWTSSDRDED